MANFYPTDRVSIAGNLFQPSPGALVSGTVSRPASWVKAQEIARKYSSVYKYSVRFARGSVPHEAPTDDVYGSSFNYYGQDIGKPPWYPDVYPYNPLDVPPGPLNDPNVPVVQPGSGGFSQDPGILDLYDRYAQTLVNVLRRGAGLARQAGEGAVPPDFGDPFANPSWFFPLSPLEVARYGVAWAYNYEAAMYRAMSSQQGLVGTSNPGLYGAGLSPPEGYILGWTCGDEPPLGFSTFADRACQPQPLDSGVTWDVVAGDPTVFLHGRALADPAEFLGAGAWIRDPDVDYTGDSPVKPAFVWPDVWADPLVDPHNPYQPQRIPSMFPDFGPDVNVPTVQPIPFPFIKEIDRAGQFEEIPLGRQSGPGLGDAPWQLPDTVGPGRTQVYDSIAGVWSYVSIVPWLPPMADPNAGLYGHGGSFVDLSVGPGGPFWGWTPMNVPYRPPRRGYRERKLKGTRHALRMLLAGATYIGGTIRNLFAALPKSAKSKSYSGRRTYSSMLYDVWTHLDQVNFDKFTTLEAQMVTKYAIEGQMLSRINKASTGAGYGLATNLYHAMGPDPYGNYAAYDSPYGGAFRGRQDPFQIFTYGLKQYNAYVGY